MNEAIIDLVETLIARIERRVQQIQRVARQQHGLQLDDAAAMRVFNYVITNEMRFAQMLHSDDVEDAYVAMIVAICRAKAPQLFQHKEPTT